LVNVLLQLLHFVDCFWYCDTWGWVTPRVSKL